MPRPIGTRQRRARLISRVAEKRRPRHLHQLRRRNNLHLPRHLKAPSKENTKSVTALDAVTDATDHPPEIIKAPDGSGEIFWRKGKEGEGPEEVLNWVMWFRDSKSSQETQIGRLRGFPSFEPLHIRGNEDQQFLFEGPLRLTFFSCHLDSTNGDTVEAFGFNKRKLIQLSPNYATPVPLPGEPAFLTLH